MTLSRLVRRQLPLKLRLKTQPTTILVIKILLTFPSLCMKKSLVICRSTMLKPQKMLRQNQIRQQPLPRMNLHRSVGHSLWSLPHSLIHRHPLVWGRGRFADGISLVRAIDIKGNVRNTINPYAHSSSNSNLTFFSVDNFKLAGYFIEMSIVFHFYPQ